MIRGILFDKDGTLFDFNATWRGVMQEPLDALAPGDPARAARMARAVGYDPDIGAFEGGSAIVAGSSADVARIWADHVPGMSVAALEIALNARAEAAGPDNLVPAAADLPGLLDTFRSMGCALGVATHDSEAGARGHLRAVGALSASPCTSSGSPSVMTSSREWARKPCESRRAPCGAMPSTRSPFGPHP